MTATRKLTTLFLSFFVCTCLNAQVEVAHLGTKGFSALGFGAFLNFAVPVSEGSSIAAEAGFYYFKSNNNNIALVPFLLGYRYTLDATGTGFYVEPDAGYTTGGSDIEKTNQYGSPIPDGNGGWLNQKVKGPTAGIGAGYIFPGNFAFNIGLRYQHVFVSGDPTLNMFSLRLSHTISFRRKEY
jgi:hypothetical protein